MARRRVSHLDGTIVVLVGDENVAVGEKLSSVRVVQLVATYADYTVLPVLPYDGIVTPLDFYDPLVTLVGDEHVAIWQERVLDWRIQLVRSEPRHTELAILPDDVTALVDEENPVVDTARFAVRSSPRRDACAGHQCEAAHALSIIGSSDSVRRSIAGTVPELPDDDARGGDFDDAVVELVSDQNISGLVEACIGGLGRTGGKYRRKCGEC